MSPGGAGPSAISLSEVVVDRGGIGGVETAEKNWVMMGWDGSAVVRLRLRDGGGWRRLRAVGLKGERGVVGDWAAVGGVLAYPYIPVQGSPGVVRES